jgi:hypothetical protein
LTNRNYRIKIATGSDVFEVEGDKEFVLKMLAAHYEKTASRTQKPTLPHRTPITAPAQPPAGPSEKSESAGEFIRRTGFTKHTDRTLAFGYFLERQKGQQDFTGADINACYYEAKLEASNTPQMITQNIKSGRLMLAKASKETKGERGRRRYTLTRTGMEFVEQALSATA